MPAPAPKRKGLDPARNPPHRDWSPPGWTWRSPGKTGIRQIQAQAEILPESRTAALRAGRRAVEAEAIGWVCLFDHEVWREEKAHFIRIGLNRELTVSVAEYVQKTGYNPEILNPEYPAGFKHCWCGYSGFKISGWVYFGFKSCRCG